MTRSPLQESGEPSPSETNRWGNRFVRSEVEAAYRAWSHMRAVPVVRARALVSAVAWAGIAGLSLVAGPSGFAAWWPGFALVGASLAAIDWAARRGSPRLASVAVLVGNAVTGLVAVSLASEYLGLQTAERSRELGAVLARSEVRLDARRLSEGRALRRATGSSRRSARAGWAWSTRSSA